MPNKVGQGGSHGLFLLLRMFVLNTAYSLYTHEESEDTFPRSTSPRRSPSSSDSTSAGIRSPLKSKPMNKKKDSTEVTKLKKPKNTKEKKVSSGILLFMAMLKKVSCMYLASECLTRVCPSIPLWTICHPGSSIQGRGSTTCMLCKEWLPYDVICVLFQKPSWRGYLSKSQLITEAQPHCDTSFTVVYINYVYTDVVLILCPNHTWCDVTVWEQSMSYDPIDNPF